MPLRLACRRSYPLLVWLAVYALAPGTAIAASASSSVAGSSLGPLLHTSRTVTDPNAPLPVPATDLHQPGRRLTSNRVLAIAAAHPRCAASGPSTKAHTGVPT